MGIGSLLQKVRKLEIGRYKWLADDHILDKDSQGFSLGLWNDKFCPLEVCITLIPWYRAPASSIFISSKLSAKPVTEQIVSVCLLSEHFQDSLCTASTGCDKPRPFHFYSQFCSWKHILGVFISFFIFFPRVADGVIKSVLWQTLQALNFCHEHNVSNIS